MIIYSKSNNHNIFYLKSHKSAMLQLVALKNVNRVALSTTIDCLLRPSAHIRMYFTSTYPLPSLVCSCIVSAALCCHVPSYHFATLLHCCIICILPSWLFWTGFYPFSHRPCQFVVATSKFPLIHLRTSPLSTTFSSSPGKFLALFR